MLRHLLPQLMLVLCSTCVLAADGNDGQLKMQEFKGFPLAALGAERYSQQLNEALQLQLRQLSESLATPGFVTRQRLLADDAQLNAEAELSPTCALAYSAYLEALIGFITNLPTPNAQEFVKVLDALGKPESGVLAGNLRWLGSRTVCETLSLTVRNTSSRDATFKSSGMQCIYTLASTDQGEASGNWPTLAAIFEWGICTPAVCSVAETQIVTDLTLRLALDSIAPIVGGVPIVGDLVKTLNSTKLVIKKCPVSSKEAAADMHLGAIIMITLTALLVTLVIVATCVIARAENLGMSLESKSLQFFKAFCLRTNLKKLFAPAPANALHCLNGIRVMSIMWVMLGHTLLILLGFMKEPVKLTAEFRGRWYAPIFLNATMSVDTFFVLSGALVAYVFFKKIGTEWKAAKSKIANAKFWGLFYFHRYLRLTPPLMFFTLWYMNILPYIGDSYDYPTDRKVYDIARCEGNWWELALYVQNFVSPGDSCIGQSWYLANDMQMYWVSPVLLLSLLIGGLKLGSVVITAAVAASMAATGVINAAYGFKFGILPTQPGVDEGFFPGDTHYDLVYVKPYCRIGAYCIGILLGYVLASRKCLKIDKYLVALLWLLALGFGIATVYVMQPHIAGTGPEMTLVQGTAYVTLMRPVFSICVAWVVIACVYGYGGIVNELLSWSWWAPLAKLTYCAYIVHMVLQYMLYANTDNRVQLENATLLVFYCATLIVSFTCSMCLSMLVEVPVMGLEKLLLPDQSGRKRPSSNAVRPAPTSVVDNDKKGDKATPESTTSASESATGSAESLVKDDKALSETSTEPQVTDTAPQQTAVELPEVEQMTDTAPQQTAVGLPEVEQKQPTLPLPPLYGNRLPKL